MCGIVGLFNVENAVSSCIKGLEIIKNRGKDGCGIYYDKLITAESISLLKNKIKKESFYCIGHNLHSIVGYVIQPIIKDEYVLAINCEIYNWKELKNKYDLKSENDAGVVLDLICKKGVKELKNILDELRGTYAFCLLDKKKNEVYIARDIIGVKPMWYYFNGLFCFASEKKVLESYGFVKEENIEELNPREIIKYDIQEKRINKLKREFFSTGFLIKDDEKKITERLRDEIIDSIRIRIPEKRFGILFSGGIDSTIIAYVCSRLRKENKHIPDFICYVAGLEGAKDIESAKRAAKKLGFRLKIKKIEINNVEDYIKKIISLIEDNNVVKVGVALPIYLACELAKEDGIKVIFSGLGAEELFAGYKRHELSYDINKECLHGLLKIYERDMYRDDVITMNNGIELRLPFLDRNLADYALKIPGELKIKKVNDGYMNKYILRKVAENLGIPEEVVFKKKIAAQYGSKFDNAISKLAKINGFKLKSEYLMHVSGIKNVPLGVLYSGGKDSNYALWIMAKQNYPIRCLISLKSKNPDSYMFHSSNIDMVDYQAKAMNIPLVKQMTKGDEEELKDLERAIIKAKKRYKIKGIATGALYSNYQRERIEKICDKLGLKIFSPLWHINSEEYLRNLIKDKFEIIITKIAADGFDEKWLGRKIDDKFIEDLKELNKKFGIHLAGEGGEYESMVLNGPLFKKKISILNSENKMESKCCGELRIKKIEIVKDK